jgi:putative endonuclease
VSKTNQNLGKAGEDIALDFLCKRGYRIIARNYRTRYGEIDIIADDGGTVCFVEVKMRCQTRYGSPEESVSRLKQRHISRAAMSFLKDRDQLESPSRFDVVSIDHSGPERQIELIQGAFVLDENDEVSDV